LAYKCERIKPRANIPLTSYARLAFIAIAFYRCIIGQFFYVENEASTGHAVLRDKQYKQYGMHFCTQVRFTGSVVRPKVHFATFTTTPELVSNTNYILLTFCKTTN
jgi:hypothetical protein